MPRDLLRIEATERLDKPDLDALQRNSRSDIRTSVVALLFAAASDKVLGGWQITANGPPDSKFNVAAGTMVGAEKLPDGTDESGVLFGLESTSPVSVDLSGQPVSPPSYNVYVRFVFNPGQPGSRIFWDDGASAEVVGSIDTREVASWTVTAATSSPGSDWIKIGEIDWDGAAVQTADITHHRDTFFEGDEGAGTPFDDVWGDGANDRNADRAQYGVGDLYTWVHAVRRQIQDILGGSNKWYTAVAHSLDDAATHAADSSDPHGATLNQTTLIAGAGSEVTLNSAGVATTAVVSTSKVGGVGVDAPDSEMNATDFTLDGVTVKRTVWIQPPVWAHNTEIGYEKVGSNPPTETTWVLANDPDASLSIATSYMQYAALGKAHGEGVVIYCRTPYGNAPLEGVVVVVEAQNGANRVSWEARVYEMEGTPGNPHWTLQGTASGDSPPVLTADPPRLNLDFGAPVTLSGYPLAVEISHDDPSAGSYANAQARLYAVGLRFGLNKLTEA